MRLNIIVQDCNTASAVLLKRHLLNTKFKQPLILLKVNKNKCVAYDITSALKRGGYIVLILLMKCPAKFLIKLLKMLRYNYINFN